MFLFFAESAPVCLDLLCCSDALPKTDILKADYRPCPILSEFLRGTPKEAARDVLRGEHADVGAIPDEVNIVEDVHDTDEAVHDAQTVPNSPTNGAVAPMVARPPMQREIFDPTLCLFSG
jgi:hypothetical protein